MDKQNERKLLENEEDVLTRSSGNEVDSPERFFDRLDEEERKKAHAIAEQIDLHSHDAITQFGTGAQAHLLQFSHDMLEHVQTKDTSEIGNVLKDLMRKLEEVNPNELDVDKQNFFSRLFRKISSTVNEIVSKYQKTGAQIDRISVKLDQYKQMLSQDNTMLDELFEKNRDYFYSLNLYIAAGEMKVEELTTKTLPDMQRRAEASGNQMELQEVNDLFQVTERLEKRIHDLKLSRQITLQSAPQIRLIQNTNEALVEKIQSSILTAIPLWKNQIVIALTLLRQRRAVEAQKQVSKTTNELLLKNAEMLKANTLTAVEENESGLVDIETLKKTQAHLISTIEETLRIQAEGRQERLKAEQELSAMEDELKATLLEHR